MPIGLDGHAGGVGRDEDLGEAVAGAADDEEVVGDVGRLDRALHARQHELVAVDPDLEGDVAQAVARVAPR